MVLVYLIFLMGFYTFGPGSFGILVAVGVFGVEGYFDIGNYFDIADCFDIGFDVRVFVSVSFRGCSNVGSCLYFVSVGADLIVGNAEGCGRCQTI